MEHVIGSPNSSLLKIAHVHLVRCFCEVRMFFLLLQFFLSQLFHSCIIKVYVTVHEDTMVVK